MASWGPAWSNPQTVLEEAEKLGVPDGAWWSLQEMRDSLKETYQLEPPQGSLDFDNALRATLRKLCEEGKLEMGPDAGGGQQPYRLAAPPPWFGPQAVLQQVQRLVASDKEKAAVGWTCNQIKVSLMQPQQQEDQHSLMLKLKATLSRLCEMGDLKVVGVVGEKKKKKKRYTLADTPPCYLPPWFGPEAVNKAVKDFCDPHRVHWHGVTWEELRESLKATQKLEADLPLGLEPVLRTMLFVLCQRGHLVTNPPKCLREGDSCPLRYTWRRAPVLDELNPIGIPNHHWFYYLGYKLAASDGIHDHDGEPSSYIDALYYVKDLPWFGPRTVLEEVERLVDNANDNDHQGWTWEEVRDSLVDTHTDQQQQQIQNPHRLDSAVRYTLVELHARGNLMTKMEVGTHELERYTLSDEPPSLPEWFGPKAVLDAVDDNAGGGSTSAQIMDSLLRKHQPQRRKLPPGFKTLLVAFLELLRQRGHLARGAGGRRHYTQPQAPAPNPLEDNLWCYYLGYKLGVLRRQGRAPPRQPAQVDMMLREAVGLRRLPGRGNSEQIIANTETDIVGSTSTPKEREKQRLRYLIWRLFLSVLGHGILLLLSWKFGEGKSAHHEEQSSILRQWFMWAMMYVIVPAAVLIGMILAQIFWAHLDVEDTSQQTREEDKKRMKTNEIVNLAMLAGSKLLYLAIKEAPGRKDVLLYSAHAVAFMMDMAAALILWRRHSRYDQELPEFKTD